MTMAPDPDDFDFSDMEAQLSEVEVVATFSVATLNDPDLLTKYRDLTEELKNRKEALHPKTETGRELHSLRSSCFVELHRRGIL